MALATLATCKLYLRKQTTAEDTLIAALLASAIGRVEAYIRRPIIATEMTFVDDAVGFGGRRMNRFVVPVTPIASIESVTDTDETELDVEELRFGVESGVVVAKDGTAFASGPYTIVASVGLSARENYASRIEPVINQAILDVVADLYQRRNPAAAQEATGGGVSVAYTQGDNGGLPDRTASLLKPFRMVGVSG